MKKEKNQNLGIDVQKSLIESLPEAKGSLDSLDIKSKEIIARYKIKELNNKVEKLM